MGGIVAWLLLLLAPAALAADVLHIYNWNNYIAPETLERFKAQCRCRVVYDTYGSNDELLAKLAAGAKGYDLLVPTGFALESLIRQQALLPVDKSLLPNLKNISPAFLDGSFDKGNAFSVPYAYTVTLIGYNEDKIRQLQIPVNTWAAIFDPRYLAKMKGRVTVLDDQRELMAAALKYLGYSVNDKDEAHWRQAAEVIIKAKPYWAAFMNTGYIRLLSTGDIWLVHGYSNDIFQASAAAARAGKGVRVGSAVPREGAVLALDSMVIHKDAPRPELAHRFIDFMLEGRNAAELTNLTGSGSPNLDAMQYVRAEVARNEGIFPGKSVLGKLEPLQDLDRRKRRLLNRLWTEIKLSH